MYINGNARQTCQWAIFCEMPRLPALETRAAFAGGVLPFTTIGIDGRLRILFVPALSLALALPFALATGNACDYKGVDKHQRKGVPS